MLTVICTTAMCRALYSVPPQLLHPSTTPIVYVAHYQKSTKMGMELSTARVVAPLAFLFDLYVQRYSWLVLHRQSPRGLTLRLRQCHATVRNEHRQAEHVGHSQQ